MIISKKWPALLALLLFLTVLMPVRMINAATGEMNIQGTGTTPENYYYWSFEDGASPQPAGVSPWHGGTAGIWQGFYSNALSTANAPQGEGLQGSKALKLSKTRVEGTHGISTVDGAVLAMASVPGNVVTAMVYIAPEYVGQPLVMQDVNLRDMSAVNGTAGEVYSIQSSSGSQLAPGWNRVRYQVPANKTDMWTKGRLSINIRTLLNAAAVKALYPEMSDEAAAAYSQQLKNDITHSWYVDAIYIGPSVYEPDPGELPAGFVSDGLNSGPVDDSSPPALSGASALRQNRTTGVVVFQSNKSGAVYYKIGGEPSVEGTGHIAVAGTNTLFIPMPTDEGALVHVLVKDWKGRISAPGFTVSIPAYIPPEEPQEPDRVPYYFWSFEEGATTGSPGINPWKGEALVPWEGYYSTSLAVTGYGVPPAGAHGERALRVGKTRAESTLGISISDPGAVGLARIPGHVVTAQVYVQPDYAAASGLWMQELSLRDWSASGSAAGERYAGKTLQAIQPGWNTLRYQVPEGKTDAWPLGRITINASTLSNAASAAQIYPHLDSQAIAELLLQLREDLTISYYVDSIYIGPAAYEPQQAGSAPVRFLGDGLNYTAPAPGEEPEDLPGPAADPQLVYASASAADNASADGSPANPYRTIGAAIKAASSGAKIVVGPGTYRETIRPKDRQTIEGVSGAELPVISGLDLVKNWTQDPESGLYTASMDWSLDTTYQTTGTKVIGGGNQVFINGELAYEARWPNAGATAPPEEGGLFQFRRAVFDTVSMNYSVKTATVKDSELAGLSGTSLAGASMWVISGQKWSSRPATVLDHNGQAITISLNGGAANATEQYYHPRPGNEYILYGLKAFLDTEEEWYWDKVERKLYVKTNPAGRLIESKRRETAVDLSGTTGVTLKSIAVKGATISSDGATQNANIDGIRAEYVNQAANFDNGYVYDNANNGILLAGRNNILQNSELAYASGGLVTLQGENNRLINNYIHDADYTGGWVSAVNLAGTGHVAAYNTITRAGRDLINLRQTKSGLIEHNDISYAGELCEDLGMLYTYSADGAGTEIRYNRIHDSEIANGIYLDNNSTHFVVHHNVSYNLKARSGLKNNAYSALNLFFNNTNYNEAPMNMIALTNYPLTAYGTRYYNNILGNSYSTAPDTAWSSNVRMGISQATSIFRNPGEGDFRLKEGVTTWYGAASGKILEGINETGYIGAYAYDPATGAILNDFATGHNFTEPPGEIPYSLTATPYKNAVTDGGFDRSTASDNYTLGAPWSVYGSGPVRVKRDAAYYIRNDGFGVHLAGAGTGIKQTVEHLKPDTDYILTARVQSAPETGIAASLNGGRARIGVTVSGVTYSAEAESARLVVRANTGTQMPEWVLVTVPFHTGGSTSAEIFAQTVWQAANVDHIAVTLPLTEGDPRALLGEVIMEAEGALQSAHGMPQEIAAGFRQAIDASWTVWHDSAATSAGLEAQREVLEEAYEVFSLRKGLLSALDSAKQLSEDMIFDGGDYHYPPSAQSELDAVIAAQQLVLEDNQATPGEISAAAAAVEAAKLALYNAIILPPISIYTEADMGEMLSSGESWSRKGLTGDYVVDGEGFMHFRSSTGEGNNQWSKGATFYNVSRFGNESFVMDMDYQPAAGDWPAFVLRAQVAQESIFGDNQNEYVVVFRAQDVELQKWINGAEDTSFRLVFPSSVISAGLNRVQLGAADIHQEGEFAGVRLFFYVNGVRVFDILDRTVNAVRGDGYFGLALYPPAQTLKLRAVSSE